MSILNYFFIGAGFTFAMDLLLGIKRIQNQKRTLEALGLRGIGKEVTHESTPNILGMIAKVQHLVTVTEV